jgi:hypothetical protein
MGAEEYLGKIGLYTKSLMVRTEMVLDSHRKPTTASRDLPTVAPWRDDTKVHGFCRQ